MTKRTERFETRLTPEIAARLEEARGIASASAWIARAIERDLDRETAAPAGERCPTCGRIG